MNPVAVLQRISSAWKLYFPGRDFDRGDGESCLKLCQGLFHPAARDRTFGLVDWGAASAISVKWADLVKVPAFEEMAVFFMEDPGPCIAHLSLAVAVGRSILLQHDSVERIAVRVLQVQPTTPLSDLKANTIGRFVSLMGNVVRVSGVRPLVQNMFFECEKCRALTEVSFQDGQYRLPARCSGDRCRSTRFEPCRSSAQTQDWQKIKIQELETDEAEAGRIPRTIEVELSGDLVDTCVPGDVVCIAGTVKAINAEVAAGRRSSRVRNLHMIYVDAHSVLTTKIAAGGTLDSKEFSDRELRLVQKIARHPNPLAMIVASLCPSIFGHEAVKAGLALGLFGGSNAAAGAEAASGNPAGTSAAAGDRGDDGAAQTDRNSSKVAVRCDPHVLVVGDPGMGKSQMLRAVGGLAPRGVYVGGNTASSTGLTVTMVRDQVTGDFGLEAGALVLSDQGVCCIDEFDKMSKADHEALLEAMEQQRISMAKAGMVCSLNARCSVLAAANPVGGHYDRAKTVQENLKLPAPLLSRFDLIFILMDRPDLERDRQLSAHVMAMHSSLRSQARAGSHWQANPGLQAGARARSLALTRAEARLTQQQRADRSFAQVVGGSQAAGAQPWEAKAPLDTRLRPAVAAISDPIPHALLRKYVAYSRRYCHPVLSSRAAKLVQDFYLSLRANYSTDDATPITTRQLEAMVRLVQARARIELKAVASARHAIDVVQLMKESLFDVCMDQMGVVDFARSAGMSMGKQVKLFVAALNREARRRGSALFTRDELGDLASQVRLDVPSLYDFLEVLNQQSYILKKGPRLYQLMTSEYDRG